LLNGDGVIEQQDALLRYYFKIETNNLTDDEFFSYFCKLKWVLEQKNRQNG
jgi:hypothetical protein